MPASLIATPGLRLTQPGLRSLNSRSSLSIEATQCVGQNTMRIFPVFRGNYVFQNGIPPFKLPCWPRPSKLTALLTRDIYIVMCYFFITAWSALALLFGFAKQADNALKIFGDESNFISSFPFIRYLHFRFGLFTWIKPIDIGYFHLLDLTLWISLVFWGIWLALGLIFLRQYDDLFQKRSPLISKSALLPKIALARTPIRYLAMPLYVLALLWFLSLPFSITYMIAQDRLLSDPEIVFVINNLTGLFFYFFAILYCYGISFLAIVFLFLSWKMFRQKWPGVILWHEDYPNGSKQVARIDRNEIRGRR